VTLERLGCKLDDMHSYHVYIIASHTRTLYIGVTSNLEQRIIQHKKKLVKGFTSKYNVTQLVWFEEFNDISQAIECEKKLKAWKRSKKIELIEKTNPLWLDLAESL